jgi:drug/metabolite transporter (DMT)-like permease
VQTHPDAWQALGFVLLLAAVGTALTVVLFYELLRLAGTLLASSVTYCIPAVALLWGVAFGEPVGWVHAVAFAGILCGVWLVSRPEAKPQPLTK